MLREEKLVSGFIIGLIVLFAAISFLTYPQLPDKVPSNWNTQGEPTSYMQKSLALMIFPGIAILILLVYLAIPRVDPLKRNIEKFRRYFDGLIVLIVLFILYLHLMIIAWGLGYRFNMGQLISPILGALLYYVGMVLEKTKRNWFIGIRTPWTLSSNQVWEDTHKVGSKLFKISGLIAVLGLALPDYVIYLLVGPVILSSIFTFVYSYFKYKGIKEKDKEKLVRD